MAKDKEKKKSGGKKLGRYKIKCDQYRKRQQKEKRALRHMLKSNRYEDVVAYAVEHNLKAPPRPARKQSPLNRRNAIYVLDPN